MVDICTWEYNYCDCLEEWKCIDENYYISSKGRCYSEKSNKYLKASIQPNGYLTYGINNKTKRVHHLVAKHFIGDRPDENVIDHIDHNKKNNCVCNLRYCTNQENLLNRECSGTIDFCKDQTNHPWRFRYRIDNERKVKSYKTKDEAVVHQVLFETICKIPNL